MRSSNSLSAIKSCARASINHVVGFGLSNTHMLRCGYFIYDLATLFRLRGLLQGRMVQRLINSEWQGIGQDGGLSCFHIPSRYFDGLRKTRNVGQNNQFPRQNLTPITQKHESKGLLNETRSSGTDRQISSSLYLILSVHTRCSCLLYTSCISSYCTNLVLAFLHVSATYCGHHQGSRSLTA